jgi:pSer/pThr/pTyr-binding forkhead associated (FHA) protein
LGLFLALSSLILEQSTSFAEKALAMFVRLVMNRKRKRIWKTELRRPETTLGRSNDCTIRIPSAEVSRQHCRLRIENGVVTVEDLESANGTFLNGDRVHDIEIVHPGDQLRIGPVTLVVEYELTTNTMRDLSSEDYAVPKKDREAEFVENPAPQPLMEPLSLAEPLPMEEVDQVEEVEADAFVFDNDPVINLPEGGDLNAFLLDLDETDERG